MKGLILLYQYRNILWSTTLTDIKGRYSGTTFGLMWTVIYPILFLGLYALVFVMIYKVKLGEMTTFDYVLLIFSGLIPFFGFAEALGSGVSSVVSNKNLIKNTMFPIELIPVKAVLSSSITMLVGLTLLLGILWGQGNFHYTQLMIPVILILQLVFTIGLIWTLSALNVFFQDISQVIGVSILLLMLISPIAYTIDMIPAALMPIMYPNPLYYLIMLYRETTILGVIPYDLLAIFSVIAFTFFCVGFSLFSRLKKIFPDFL